jgi:c-di-GMP-binding flagellar brake protein YcgR
METPKLTSVPGESFFCPIGTELMLRVENNDVQMKSALVGMDRGKFLILKTPKTPDVESLLKVEQSVKCIFLHNGTIFGFISKVLNAIELPAPLFFLSCPAEMERHELRKNLRIDCSIPVGIHKDEKTEYTGVVTDLSSGGCGVTISNAGRPAPADMPIDSVLGLSCEMLGIQQGRNIRCIVKNQFHDDKKMHIGFQFDNNDADILEKIQSYVNRVLGVIY